VLVAGSQSEALPKAREAVGTMHGMAGERHPGISQTAYGKLDYQ
jgi:hypothetical protein